MLCFALLCSCRCVSARRRRRLKRLGSKAKKEGAQRMRQAKHTNKQKTHNKTHTNRLLRCLCVKCCKGRRCCELGSQPRVFAGIFANYLLVANEAYKEPGARNLTEAEAFVDKKKKTTNKKNRGGVLDYLFRCFLGGGNWRVFNSLFRCFVATFCAVGDGRSVELRHFPCRLCDGCEARR